MAAHRSVEDQHIFPALTNLNKGLDRVVKHLLGEHVVIHDLIAPIQGQALALTTTPDRESYLRAKVTFETLAEKRSASTT